MRNRFVMIDGIDGSGKGTAMEALREWATEKNFLTYDLKTHWREHDDIPEIKDVKGEVIISAEPTYAMVGKGIRREIIRDNGRSYSASSTAFAFALDREILYRTLLIPALKANKYVFQDRGIVSSIVYQPVQGDISLNELLAMPGNRLAIDHPPGLIIIPTVSVKTALERLHLREKKDHAIFENETFQTKIKTRFESGWLKDLFKTTRIELVDNTADEITFKKKIKDILEDYFK